MNGGTSTGVCNHHPIATLLHLNGPPAVGKSTIATRLVADRALALALDIDEIRVRLGRWESEPDSKRVARQLGFELAVAHLRGGHDVVMPQLVVDPSVIDHIEQLAADAGARYIQVVLVADPADLLERATAPRVGSPHPRDDFSRDDLAAQITHALDVLHDQAGQRRSTHVIDVNGLSPDEVVDWIQSLLS